MTTTERQTNSVEADACEVTRAAWVRTAVAQVILDRTDPEQQAEVRAALEELGYRAGVSEASLRLLSDE